MNTIVQFRSCMYPFSVDNIQVLNGFLFNYDAIVIHARCPYGNIELESVTAVWAPVFTLKISHAPIVA